MLPRKLFVIFTPVLVFTLIFVGCFDLGDDEDDSSDRAMLVYIMQNPINNSIVSIPSCLKQSPVSNRGKATRDDAGSVGDVYALVVETLKMIDEIVNGEPGTDNEGLKIFVANVAQFITTTDGEFTTDDGIRIVWGDNTDTDSRVSEYEHKLVAYNSSGIKYLETYLTINNVLKNAKGLIIFDLSNTPNETSTAWVQVIFDGTVDPKIIDVQVTDPASSGEDVRSAWIYMDVASNNVFNLKGNFYFPALGELGEKNYVFTATGFHEFSIINANKAILNLAIPDSDISDTANMWNDYSVGDIYSQLMLTNIKADSSVQTGWAAIKAWAATGGVSLPDDLANLSVDEMIELFEFAIQYSSASEAADLSTLLFVADLVNSAYFNASGFVGTYNAVLGRGTLDAVPSGFDGLDISSVIPTAPSAVKDLVISFITP